MQTSHQVVDITKLLELKKKYDKVRYREGKHNYTRELAVQEAKGGVTDEVHRLRDDSRNREEVRDEGGDA